MHLRSVKSILLALILFSSLNVFSATVAQEISDPADLPNIVILGTGGTIAGTAATATSTINYTSTLNVDDLIAAAPGIEELADLTGEQVFNIGSPNITDVDRIVLANRVNLLLARDDVDGIVITHGTETIEQTAYFLNLVVKSSKPVIVVGAMRPSSALSADGPMNLYKAVMVAATQEAHDKGVLIVMNDRIGAARFINKLSNWNVDAFGSMEQGYLGDVVSGIVRFYQAPLIAHTYQTEFNIEGLESLPPVEILYGSLGTVSTAMIDAAVEDGVKGIIIAGGVSGEADDRLNELMTNGEVIVVSSFWQASGNRLSDRFPKLWANSLTPHKARILLQIALAHTMDPDVIQGYFDNY